MLSSLPSKLAMLIALCSFIEFNAQTWSIPITEVDQPVDFQMMDASFEKARIVGVGESTHGTHEFNVMYARTFKYLVEHHGYTTLFIEDEFSRCLKINDYLQGKTEEVHLADELRNWPWRTEEMNELFRWIRAYNLSREESITLVGVDSQDARHIRQELNGLLVERGKEPVSLPEETETLSEASYEQEQRMLSSDSVLSAYRKELWPENTEFFWRYSTDSLIGGYRKELWPESTEYFWRYSNLLECLYFNHDVQMNPKYRVRDLAMGKRVMSYLAEHPKAKGMVIAHNGHLYKYYQKKRNEYKRRALMGGVLSQELGEAYVYILQDFHQGCFNAYGLKNVNSDKALFSNYELGPRCAEPIEGESFTRIFPPEGNHIRIVAAAELDPKRRKQNDLWSEKYLKYHIIGAVYPNRVTKSGKVMDYFYLTRTDGVDFLLLHPESTPTNLLK